MTPRVPSGGGEGQREKDLGERIRARVDVVRAAAQAVSDYWFEALASTTPPEVAPKREANPGDGRAVSGEADGGSLSFSALAEANLSRARRWHPGFPIDDDWNVADWSNAMCGEAGEAANKVKKLRRHETGHHGALDGDRAELLEGLGKELADVILYADLLAAKSGIDLTAAIVQKFNEVSERQGFPERLASATTKAGHEESDLGGEQGSPSAEVGVCCVICGKDLTPTPEQLIALERFGNPLRREPCLLTENGLHRVDEDEFDRFMSTTRPEAAPRSEGDINARQRSEATANEPPNDRVTPSGSLPDTARRLDFALAVIDDHGEEHPDARLRVDYEQRVEEEETEARGQAMEP